MSATGQHKNLRENLLAFTFSAPALVLLLTIHIVPLVTLAVLSFTDYELGAISVSWLGLENFIRAFDDAVFRRALGNTLLYVAIVIPGSVIVGLVVALLVHARKRTRTIYEVIYFLPVTSTLVAMATIWQFLLHPRLGPVNAVIKSLGFSEIAFLNEPTLVIPTLAVIGLWQMIGFNMILFLAGLSTIPREYYDAAQIDGAGGAVDRFLRVTWPMLGPTTMFVIVTTSISAFKVFDTVAVLTHGRGGSEVLLYAIYLEGFHYFKMGYAAALTLIFLAFILVLSVVQARRMDNRVHYA